MKTLPCDDAALAATAAVLLAGGVAVIPTDTVYGLAAHPDRPDAVARLYAIKGREARKPIALLAADFESAAGFLGGPPPPAARRLAARFWPGALTLVLPKGDGFEGLRVPDHDWTRRLLAACGGVLRVTSANLSGRRPATDAPDALAAVGLSADLVVDGGVSPGGLASTVVKVDPSGAATVLRQGGVRIAPLR
ncbi:MAG: L-threonylcarbamoyladenylate synthase [Kiritimatiellia bacterium]